MFPTVLDMKNATERIFFPKQCERQNAVNHRRDNKPFWV